MTEEQLAELEALARTATPAEYCAECDRRRVVQLTEREYLEWERDRARAAVPAMAKAMRESWAAHRDARERLGEAWKAHDAVCAERDALRAEVETLRAAVKAAPLVELYLKAGKERDGLLVEVDRLNAVLNGYEKDLEEARHSIQIWKSDEALIKERDEALRLLLTRVEASRLDEANAQLAAVTAERDRMRGLLHRAVLALPPRPSCRDCADHDGTCQSAGKEPCDPYEALPVHIAAVTAERDHWRDEAQGLDGELGCERERGDELQAEVHAMRPVVEAARRFTMDDVRTVPELFNDLRSALFAYERAQKGG